MLRNYSQNTLDLFSDAIKGKKKAFKALMTTEKHPELAAFSNAIKGDQSAEIWLKARGGSDLYLMCKAIDDSEVAFKLLQNKEDKFAVGFVLACKNNVAGTQWLEDNNYSHFLPVCEAIHKAVKIARIERTFSFYRGDVRRLDL